MMVHDITEHEQARATYVPNRHKTWRKDLGAPDLPDGTVCRMRSPPRARASVELLGVNCQR